MEKTRKKHLKLVLIFCIFQSAVMAQAKSGLENYNFLSQYENYVWMPIMHYQSKKGMYAELRYNYEDLNTISLYGGKTFEGGKNLQFAITPMLGVSIGNFKGVSLATNTELDWKNIYLSSQTQYSFSTINAEADFFFTWSELAYNISRKVFAGLALQFTRQQGINDAEPGFVAGLNIKNTSIPFYAFSPFGKKKYFIIGINYEFNINDKR